MKVGSCEKRSWKTWSKEARSYQNSGRYLMAYYTTKTACLFQTTKTYKLSSLSNVTTRKLHQQKNLFVRTHWVRTRTKCVRCLRSVLPDLPRLLCISSLAPDAPRRSTFLPSRPADLVHPHSNPAPPPCLGSLILSSTGLLLNPTGCVHRVPLPTSLPPPST